MKEQVQDGEEELSWAGSPWQSSLSGKHGVIIAVLVFGVCLEGTVEVKAVMEVMSFVINCQD